VRHSRQESHYYAQRHPTGPSYSRGTGISHDLRPHQTALLRAK
jgi:hypothetical protein